MSALEKLEGLPDWPARMTAPVAARYMGISTTAFLTRFKATGVKEGANLLWARAQLDQMIADQFKLGGMAVVDEYELWKAGRARR